MIILLCGLSGAGKTTLSKRLHSKLSEIGKNVELIDGDSYRGTLCHDLGFSKEDRCENIRRMGFVADKLSKYGIITIISAICPYEEVRIELKNHYEDLFLAYIHCPIPILIARDTKGLYKRALLPDNHPQKLRNLSGVNDDFEVPENADIFIDTSIEEQDVSAERLLGFVKWQLAVKANSNVRGYKDLVAYKKVV